MKIGVDTASIESLDEDDSWPWYDTWIRCGIRVAEFGACNEHPPTHSMGANRIQEGEVSFSALSSLCNNWTVSFAPSKLTAFIDGRARKMETRFQSGFLNKNHALTFVPSALSGLCIDLFTVKSSESLDTILRWPAKEMTSWTGNIQLNPINSRKIECVCRCWAVTFIVALSRRASRLCW